MPRRKTNLNNLRVLSAILKETNLSRASDLLDISQPALSNVLKQLREEFNDPLLVRVGNRMELTPKARALQKPLDNIFRDIDVLWEAGSTEPKASTRHVLIGSTDYGACMTAAPLYKRLSKEAPGIRVQFIDAAETKEMIDKESELDFYLAPDVACSSPAFQDFKYIPLFEDEMVYMVSKHHRLAKIDRPSHEEINREAFICFHTGMERSSMEIRRHLRQQERDHNVVFRVQQFSFLPSIAANTDAVVILPRRMAEDSADKYGCVVLGPASPAFRFSFYLLWDAVFHSDEVHKFLRETIKSLF